MNDNLPHCELPLASSIEFAQEAMTLHLGYEVQLASLKPIDRDGKQNLIVFWRRKPPMLHVVRDVKTLKV